MFEAFASREIQPDLGSSVQMGFTGDDISHVGIIYYGDFSVRGDHFRGPRVFHAVPPQVCHEPFDDVAEGHVILRKPLKVLDPMAALWWLIGNCGKDYAQSQLPGFIFKDLQPMLENGDSAFICSEFLSSFCWVHTDLDLPSDWKRDFVKPMQIWERIP